MRKFGPLAILALIVDLILLVIGLSHLPSVTSRPGVPFQVSDIGEQTLVKTIDEVRAAGNLRRGDEIVSWNSKPLRTSGFLEFAADCSSIGDQVQVGFRRGGAEGSTTITLIASCPSVRFVVVYGFVGLAFWLIGLFILFRSPDQHPARVLHWSVILMGATLLLTRGRIDPQNSYSIFTRGLFLLVYPLMGATFLYFSTLFPRPKLGPRVLKALVIFAPALLSAALLISSFVPTVQSEDPAGFVRFQFMYDVCHVLLIIYGTGTIASIIHSYFIARTREERHKLQWMMWGFAVGPTPFIVLVIVPQLLLSVDLVPEEYATLFLVIVPFSLAISFLKYQVMDVTVLINRSIVYAVLSVFIGAVYVSVVLLLVSAFGGARITEEYFFVVTLSLLIAILLNPLRRQVQKFVDATLFPARTRYRELVREISAEFTKMISVDDLYAGMVRIVEKCLPVSTAAFYSYDEGGMTLHGILPPGLLPRFNLSDLHAREIALPRVYASPSVTNFDRGDVDTTKDSVLKRLGVQVGLPLVGESGILLGMLIVNPCVDTKRFDEGEIDLPATIGHQAEGALERLQLQEKFFIEREQKRHAEELNSLKSYYVSSVSHELRTPLTSIRMFGDTLRDHKITSRKRRKEYLGIIIGEAERLGRLVNNILDYSKIERGVKEFHFATIDFLVCCAAIIEQRA